MIRAGVQQIPFMGYQNKTFLARQISLHAFPGVLIQVIGRLVNQQKIIFSGKEYCQHNLGPLSKAQSFKRPVQCLRIQAQLIHFTQNPPLLTSRFPLFRQLCAGPPRLFQPCPIGKIIKPCTAGNGAAVRILPHQEAQKCRFPLSIPSCKSQFPSGVHCE